MTMKKVKAVLLVLSVICNVAVWAGYKRKYYTKL